MKGEENKSVPFVFVFVFVLGEGLVMMFYVLKSKSSLGEVSEYPAIVMRRDSWDDYGYKTTVELTYYPGGPDSGVSLGYTKVIKRGAAYGYTEFPSDSFSYLPDGYCSLGQNLEYYENIKNNGLVEILKLLRDCAVNDLFRADFLAEDSFKYSLLRSSQAEKMLEEAKLLFNAQVTVKGKDERDFSFKYKIRLPGSREPLELDFDFQHHDILPCRINVIVGQNGTGKSNILSNMALDISGMSKFSDANELDMSETGARFGNVNVISYSPFDSFKDVTEINEGKVTRSNIKSGILPYSFFGIRKIVSIDGKKEVALKSHDEIKRELRAAYLKILDRQFLDFYAKCLAKCLGAEFRFGSAGEVLKGFELLSSGQKILVKMVTDFLSAVDYDDLVLIDEPETYLHPQGVSNFYHCLLEMLDFLRARCILATHSPIIVQETPSRYVNILSRRAGEVFVSKPKVETLGQGISSITSDVFKVAADDFNFFNTLNKFSELKVSLEDLEAALQNSLDFRAKAYYLSVGDK